MTTSAAELAAAEVAEHLGPDFRAQAFRQTHRLVRGAVSDPASLLTWDALSGILATHRIDPPRLRLMADADAVPQHRYTVPETGRRGNTWHVLQPRDFHQQIADGATIVLDMIDELHPPIGALAAALERTLRCGVQTNLYASWTTRQGFGIHWDDHDTVIVQVAGSKRWQIWGPTRTSPTYRDVQQPEEPTSADPIADFVMHAGDLLYVPRGHWHAVAATGEEPSLHLTSGLSTHTGASLLEWAAGRLLDLEIVRADLPFHLGQADQEVTVKALAGHVADFLARPGVLAEYAEHLDAVDPGRMVPSLPGLGDVPAVAGTVVRMTTPRAVLRQEGEHVRLRAGGQDWTLAATAGPVLSALLPGTPISLGELAEVSGVPLAQVADLMRELAAHQVLAVSSPGRM